MIDRNRHAATGRFRAPRLREPSQGLPQVYGGRARRSIRDVYEVDHAHGGRNRFRWLISTCLAAMVGTITIGIVLYGSLNRTVASNISMLDQLSSVQQPAPAPLRLSVMDDGLNWAIPKSNRLHIASSALTARYTIHEQVQVRRNNRPFIQIRPYLRISMRLVPATPTNQDVIPPFNPFTLYAATSVDTDGGQKDASDERQGSIRARVVELLGGILPGNDGQELDNSEVTALVREARSAAEITEPQPALDQVGVLPGNLTPAYLSAGNRPDDSDIASISEATTVIRRSVTKSESEDTTLDRSEIRVVRIGQPTKLVGILRGMGATSWQSRAMMEAATTVLAEQLLPTGNEVRVRLVPHAERMEPEAFAVFGPLNQHLVTVKRSEDGEFIADAEFDPRVFMTSTSFDQASASDASLYASIYDAALLQKLPPDEIMKILRLLAYEIDFRRRVRDGDQLELFYEIKTEGNDNNKLGELLYVSITSGGEKLKYWRFRSQDGTVDYYDEEGQNSKKFLMRKPVRGADVRLTSGFGYRRHPIHGDRRMHTGTDWAADPGTPILAAGRGLIEEAKRKGTYGNYIRIKHANGYQTTYSHMRNFAPGMRPGVNVRQGQVIGYVGTTGLSSGPHLHYEILVNNRFVDPIKINVPQSRKLEKRGQMAFQRERARIEALLHGSPVKTASR